MKDQEMAKSRIVKKKPSRKIDNEGGGGLSGFLRSLAVDGCVTGRTISNGSWSPSNSKDPVAVAKAFKTKAESITEIIRLRTAFDDLIRTHQTEREKLIQTHASVVKELEHTNVKHVAQHLDSLNRRLLDILEAGSKGESFPRRA